MVRPVVIIENTRHWRSGEHFAAMLPPGTPVRICRAPQGELPELSGDERLILTGGEQSLLEPVPWLEQELELIRTAARRRIPMLGVCLGHQAIAVALAGRQVLYVQPALEIGWVPIRHLQPDPLLAGIPDPFEAFSWHFHAVRDLPPPFRVLAASPDTAVHACRYGDLPIWGLQFHPEITPELAAVWLQEPDPYSQEIYRQQGLDVAAIARPAQATLWGRVILTNFLTQTERTGMGPSASEISSDPSHPGGAGNWSGSWGGGAGA